MAEIFSQIQRFLNDLGWLANLLALAPVGLGIMVMGSARKWRSKYKQKKRNLFIQKMNSPAYMEWSQHVLRKIYTGLEFVSVYDKDYPAVIFRPGKEFSYPFDDLCHLTSTEIAHIDLSARQKEYLRFLGDTVKRPGMRGFATREIVLDAQGCVAAVLARATTYQQNLVTAHVLEWELFKRYNDNQQITDGILSELALRSAYHGGKPPLGAVLKPSDAYPLISVQALVIFKDYRDPSHVNWKAIVAQRSDNVAIKPGLWQIHPAGGFEVFGHENDDLDLQLEQGFDVRTALLREYAEEIHRVQEFSFCDGRESGSILSEPHVAHLLQLIHTNNASIDFLGIVTDLTILRHELSFLIVIDDPEYSRYETSGSSEARSIFRLSMAQLRTTFSTHQVHSSSAGLLQLANASDRLISLGISAELTSDLPSVSEATQ